MFTGIIQAIGNIEHIETMGDDSRYTFKSGKLDLSDINTGDSIAVNGACLTIIEKNENTFVADLSRETLNLTTFSGLNIGSKINLEKAMQLSDRINGHMVSGHIDGIGSIKNKTDEGRSFRYDIQVPETLTRFIARKGSIAIDGVSLTVNDVNEDIFSVNIIPHTLEETIFSEYQAGTRVNIEVDLIARYLEQLQTSN